MGLIKDKQLEISSVSKKSISAQTRDKKDYWYNIAYDLTTELDNLLNCEIVLKNLENDI